MPRRKKQQLLTDKYPQEKKIVSKYFKTEQNDRKASGTDDVVRLTTEKQRSEDLKILKEFDLNWEYGPCAGITRLERWERAEKHDLNPPADVKDLILGHQDEDDYLHCLWKDYDL
ncbi:DNA polymerase delta subunit 4 [Holothuria leucospilota]|uniref:DNA polymerase delta subunit 4 n=1 Tax=Holothuria leucospilota TaxID=206669 RepID=A0A9Q1CED8_HOLLE|nr:DNA polymerase delta subunit 4 [Holothuria leucospilota]